MNNLFKPVHQLAVLAFLPAIAACGLADFTRSENKASAKAPPGAIIYRESDLAAPQVFEKTLTLVWNGEKTEPGLWIALPGAPQAEQVQVRNRRNFRKQNAALYQLGSEQKKGALISSDLARSLNIAAGKTARLTIVALRREAIAVSNKARHIKPQLTFPTATED